MSNQLKTTTVTIAASGTVSTIWNTGGLFVPVAIIMPAAWDAATLAWKSSEARVNSVDPPETPASFHPSAPAIGGGTFFDVYDTEAGALVSYTVAANRKYMIHRTVQGNYLALVSSATQTAERIITIQYRAID